MISANDIGFITIENNLILQIHPAHGVVKNPGPDGPSKDSCKKKMGQFIGKSRDVYGFLSQHFKSALSDFVRISHRRS